MMLSSSYRIGLLALTGAPALGAASLLAGSGCTVDAPDAPAEDAGVYEGADAPVATCPACLAAECTAAWALCLTDEGCLGVRDCAAASGCDATCTTACACADAGGQLYRAFATCTGARATACASHGCADGGPPAPAPCEAHDASADAAPSSADTCASCAAARCDGAARACAPGTECASFLACAFTCADAECVNACAAGHATGERAAAELAACAGATCRFECGL